MPEYYQKKRSIPRFQQDLDCHQLNEIKQYFRNHSVSALSSEVSWGGLVEDMGWGAKTEFRHTAYEHNLTSIYVYKSKRGQGHMSRFLDSNKDTHFCTAPSCDLERFLASRGVKYVVLQPSPFHEYEMVRNYYGDSVTDRTGIHMINHIDEGLLTWPSALTLSIRCCKGTLRGISDPDAASGSVSIEARQPQKNL